MLKLKIYNFLGRFIPYFKSKYMIIDYYIKDWIFLQRKTYNHTAVPRVGETVVLFVNEQNIKYKVIEIEYINDDIKILLG